MGHDTAPGRAAQLDDAQFRALAQTTPDAIVTADATGTIAYVNPATERLFGRPADTMVGRPITLLMPDELRGAHEHGFARYIRTGQPRLVGTTVEVTAIDAAGRRFPAELSLGSVGSGSSVTLTAVLRDITDRRRRERHLTAQLAVTRVLAGPAGVQQTGSAAVEALTRALGWDVGGLWLLDGDGLLVLAHVWQADPAVTAAFVEAARTLSFGPHEGLPGQALAAAVPVWHDDLTAAHGFVRSEPAAAAGLRSAVCLPLVSDGRAIGVIECFTREPQPVDDDLRDMLMTVASQVSEHLERLRSQERLEEAQRHFAAELERSNGELEQFASVAAHDLATPLRTIAGFSQLLARRHGEGLDPEAREYLDLIASSAETGNRLLDNLLDYARAGAAPLRPEPVDTDAVVREVVAALASQIHAHDAEILVAPLPAVLADRVQLVQLLQNLIANAVKFAAPGRRPVVEVTGRRDGDLARLTVADNGIGIEAGGADRLFGMFTRGTGGAGPDGDGVGLAVCAKIVERHGGRIWVEPDREQGSAFHVTLPARV